jgi:hypothetical protein
MRRATRYHNSALAMAAMNLCQPAICSGGATCIRFRVALTYIVAGCVSCSGSSMHHLGVDCSDAVCPTPESTCLVFRGQSSLHVTPDAPLCLPASEPQLAPNRDGTLGCVMIRMGLSAADEIEIDFIRARGEHGCQEVTNWDPERDAEASMSCSLRQLAVRDGVVEQGEGWYVRQGELWSSNCPEGSSGPIISFTANLAALLPRLEPGPLTLECQYGRMVARGGEISWVGPTQCTSLAEPGVQADDLGKVCMLPTVANLSEVEFYITPIAGFGSTECEAVCVPRPSDCVLSSTESCENTSATEMAYCSCRCDSTEQGSGCSCPDDFTCAGRGVIGSYCVPN